MLALSIFPGRPSIVFLRPRTVRWTVRSKKKTSQFLGRLLVLALSIFPGSHPPSIVDALELNFCVRDGNRWTLKPINTNFSGLYPEN